jgi:anti-anti-sigma factor
MPLLEEETRGDVTRARLNLKSLGETEVEHLRTRLLGLAEGPGGQEVHLDLGGLEYLTSTGLELFLSLHRRLRDAGGRLSLHNVCPDVYELFAVTCLTNVLDVRRQADGHGLPDAASA